MARALWHLATVIQHARQDGALDTAELIRIKKAAVDLERKRDQMLDSVEHKRRCVMRQRCRPTKSPAARRAAGPEEKPPQVMSSRGYGFNNQRMVSVENKHKAGPWVVKNCILSGSGAAALATLRRR